MTTLLYLFNVVLEGVARVIRQQKDIKGIKKSKEKVNKSVMIWEFFPSLEIHAEILTFTGEIC